MYVVFWKKGMPDPDLDFHIKAECSEHGTVDGVQSWKKPDYRWGKYKRQYVYVCPKCAQQVEPYYTPAYTAINWDDLGDRIGDRKRPLAKKTMARIKRGLEKYGNTVLCFKVTHSGVDRAKPVTDPLSTQSTRQALAMVCSTNYFQDNARSIFDALPTQTTAAKQALVVHLRQNGEAVPATGALGTITAGGNHHGLVGMPMPFLQTFYTPGSTWDVDKPMTTVTPEPRHGLVVPMPLLALNYSPGYCKPVDDPLSVITAAGDHHSLIVPKPFMVSFYGQLTDNEIDEAMGAIPTKSKHAVISPQDLRVENCTFRMLDVPEIKAGMGFAPDYVLLGTKREQTKQCGQAVTPPVAEQLYARVSEIL